MMTKKILMLGSSVVCSLGICLAALTLTSAVVEKAYANVETPTDDPDCNKKGGGASGAYCMDVRCMLDYNGNCGTPSESCPCNK
jgi:hypothetical protein